MNKNFASLSSTLPTEKITYKDKMQENKVDGAGVRVFCILWFSGHNFFTWVDGNKILEEFLKYYKGTPKPSGLLRKPELYNSKFRKNFATLR